MVQHTWIFVSVILLHINRLYSEYISDRIEDMKGLCTLLQSPSGGDQTPDTPSANPTYIDTFIRLDGHYIK